jgi:hypothetical protein
MTSKEFVENFYKEQTEYLQTCLDENANLAVSKKIKSLNLSNEQKQIMAEVIDGILTDTYYTILLGLDGEASIGAYQELYKLFDEEGNLLTGEIEGEAWEYFQNKK